jgi:hypothetical protein
MKRLCQLYGPKEESAASVERATSIEGATGGPQPSTTNPVNRSKGTTQQTAHSSLHIKQVVQPRVDAR